ncbi:MAG: hypothetical protein WCG27_07520 [Pseudomonadota bacterium]
MKNLKKFAMLFAFVFFSAYSWAGKDKILPPLSDVSPKLLPKIAKMENSPVNFRTQAQIEAFVPADTKMIYSTAMPDLEEWIAKSYRLILETPVGRLSMCPGLNDTYWYPEIFQKRYEYWAHNLLGISLGHAKEIEKICQKADTLAAQAVKTSMQMSLGGNAYFSPKNLRKGKEYLFLLTNNQVMIDSWTTDDMETILFFDDNNFNSLRLTLLLTHELAIAMDVKWGIELDNTPGAKLWRDYLEVIPHESGERVKKMLKMGPTAKLLAVLRAYNFEKAVMNEIKSRYSVDSSAWSEITQTYDRYTTADNQQCVQSLKKLRQNIDPKLLQEMNWSSDFSQYILPDIKLARNGMYKERLQQDINDDFAADLVLLEKVTVFDKITSKTLGLCEYWAQPMLGPYVQRFQDGPRPREGGGAGGGGRK